MPSTEPNTPRMDLKHNIMASEVEVTQTHTDANETHHLISTTNVALKVISTSLILQKEKRVKPNVKEEILNVYSIV